MARIVRIAGEESKTVSLSTLRLIAGVEPDEFAEALSREVGYPISVYVYLGWEGGSTPAPRGVTAAARRVASARLHGTDWPTMPSMSRRHFLGGIATLTAVAVTGLNTGTLTGQQAHGQYEVSRRISPDGAADLEALVQDYGRSYASKRSVADLLPGATGLTHLLIDLGRRDQWPGQGTTIASLIGQMALLTGLLNLMGPRRLDDAEAWYKLAFKAAQEAQDSDIGLYALSSLAFHAVSSDRLVDALAIVEAARQVGRRAPPRTRAHAASLASELHARNGDDRQAGQCLETARRVFEDTRAAPEWKGVGWFDEAKLDAYEGGNLVLLAQYGEAEKLLRASLRRLDHTRVKHRCTSTADLAMSLASQSSVDIEEVCAYATDAFALATQIGHQESVQRVARVHFRMLRWRRHAAVKDLGERLAAAQRLAST